MYVNSNVIDVYNGNQFNNRNLQLRSYSDVGMKVLEVIKRKRRESCNWISMEWSNYDDLPSFVTFSGRLEG